MRGPFARVWVAETVSAFGSPVTTVAVQVLLVSTLSASATEIGLVTAAQWLPYLVFGLLVGVLVDRYRRRPILVASQFGAGVLLTALPVLAWLGVLRAWVLAALLLVFGLLSLANSAAAQAYLPTLVPRADLGRANARLEQSGNAAQTVGPALAGALVRLVGAPLAVLVDAASYLVSGAVLATVRVPEPAPARGPARHVGRELRAGLAYVYRHRMLAPYALATHAWFACNAVAVTVLAPYALRTLGLGSVGYGVALAATGVGGVVGGGLSPWLGARLGAGTTVVLGRWLSPLAILVVALAHPGPAGWLVAAGGQLLYGLGIGIDGPMEMAYRQSVTPAAMQGRMNATVRSVNRGTLTLGAPLAGLLADAAGYRNALVVGAVGFAVAALALTLSPFRVARVAAADT